VTFPSKHSDIWNHVAPRLLDFGQEKAEYSKGVRAMLPNWSLEIEKGSTLLTLCDMCEEVRSQQYPLLTGFQTTPEHHNMASTMRQLDQV